MYKCTNCKYIGENVKNLKFCPVCGDNVIVVQDQKKEETKNTVVEQKTVIPEKVKKSMFKR